MYCAIVTFKLNSTRYFRCIQLTHNCFPQFRLLIHGIYFLSRSNHPLAFTTAKKVTSPEALWPLGTQINFFFIWSFTFSITRYST